VLAVPLLSVLLATQDFSARLKADAMDARQQLAVAFVNLGQAGRKLGQEAKATGRAVGRGAKAAGQEVKLGAGKTGQAVKKRLKRFGQGVKEAVSPDS